MDIVRRGDSNKKETIEIAKSGYQLIAIMKPNLMS